MSIRAKDTVATKPSRFRFVLVDHVVYWTWTLARFPGRGKCRVDHLGSAAFATEAECRADVERFKTEIAAAKVEKERSIAP